MGNKFSVKLNSNSNSSNFSNFSGNWQIFPSNTRGIDFVGYKHFATYKLLRKSTFKKLKSKMLYIKKKQDKNQLINYSEWCSINSYIGWIKWCDGYRIYHKYIKPIIKSADDYYNLIILNRKGVHNI